MHTPLEVRKNDVYEKNLSPKLTLLLAFYNNVEYFRLVFASIETQTMDSFELIVCDDGSTTAAVQALQEVYKNSKIPVLHIWHADRGFTKNEALNRGIRAARSGYLVFIDGDCVLHPQFLADHFNHREIGHSLSGRRADLTQFVTKQLNTEKIKAGFLQKSWWWIAAVIFLKKDNNCFKGIRVESNLLFAILNKKYRGLVGCNFSVFKADLEKVNGFDMTYSKPGVGEDSDLDTRLQMIGVAPKPLINRGVQYHLYHPLLTRANENEAKLAEVIRTKKYFAEIGLNQLDQQSGWIKKN